MSETPAALVGLVTLIGVSTFGDDSPPDARVGALAVDDLTLPELGEVPFPLTLVSTQGAAQLRGPLQLATRAGHRVAAVRTSVRDLADAAANVRRVVAAVEELRAEGLLDDATEVTVALPAHLSAPAAQAALDELSYADLRAGIDGTDAHRWASVVDAALDREVSFETLGGTRVPAAVLAATRACLDGDPPIDLLQTDEAGALGSYDAATLERTRRWCVRIDARTSSG